MDNPIGRLVSSLIEELSDRGERVPDRGILETLFTVTFYCTLEKDEGEGIRFDIAYLDPMNPDPEPPQLIRSDR